MWKKKVCSVNVHKIRWSLVQIYLPIAAKEAQILPSRQKMKTHILPHRIGPGNGFMKVQN
jgi:hypothetical protein